MEIYIVQDGDTIESIARRYGITVERIISDNGLINPYSLVVGQTIVILFPKNIYTVQQGDTLATIAEANQISLMQLFRNNPFLYNREFVYEGETLVIQYNTIKDLQVNGYTNVFVSQEILTKAMPYLTYLSIYNYRLAENREIISYGDDADIITIAKQYNTLPLLMISALSPTGDINVEYVYEILLDNQLQIKLINEMLSILRSKEFVGVNFLISHLTEYNQRLYLNLFENISEVLRNEGYIFMITITPDLSILKNIDYHSISLLVDRIIILEDIWRKIKEPPAPVSNISLLRPFIEHITSNVSPIYVYLGIPLLGFDWAVDFIPGSTANLMSLNSTITLAHEQRVTIQYDEMSQTPYYEYSRLNVGIVERHIVWFIDARTIKALNDIVIEYDLVGTGIWNITTYNQQLFSILNAVFNIVKLPLQ